LAVEAYRDVARLGHDDPGVPPIEVRYFAYAGLRSTVRLRDGRIYVRLSDLFEAAPDDIIGALVRILLAKLCVDGCARSGTPHRQFTFATTS
jgi:hypothetical protein